MLISDIPVGGPISIEISIDNVSYEMPSSVVASKNGYILLADRKSTRLNSSHNA